MPMRNMLSLLAMFWGLLFVAAAGLAAWQLRSIGRLATPTVDQIARTMADVNKFSQPLSDSSGLAPHIRSDRSHAIEDGQTLESIECFQQYLALVPQGWTDVMNRVEYQLAVSYLRQAENENCVMCTNGDSCILPIRDQGVHQNRTGSENAIKHLTAVLLRAPDHVSSRWLLNLAHMTLGGYPEKVPERFRLPTELFESEIDFPRFENIAAKLKIDEISLAGGIVVDDFDVAVRMGIEKPSRSFATWFWDYNHDGCMDLFCGAYTANIGIFASDYIGLPHDGQTDRLYQGDGEGNFRDVSREANVSCVTVPMGSNFGDLDNDGFLDFYLGTGDPNIDSLIPNRMYLNHQGKRFVDISSAGGFAHLQKGHGVAFADFDRTVIRTCLSS